jgi:hypothetical protein
MKNKIVWKTIPIETEYKGVLLAGTLRYWAKDCAVYLLEPAIAQKISHLMYSLPVRYTSDIIPKESITDIDIVAKGKKILIALYKESDETT